MNKAKRIHNTRAGFTLVEMLVAVGIFSLFMVTALGALLSVISANNKAQTLKIAINSLNFNLEKMSRDIRSGRDYFCGDATSGGLPESGYPGSHQDCPGGDTAFSFRTKSDDPVEPESFTVYRLNGTQLEIVNKVKNGAAYDEAVQPFASDLVEFSNISFFVDGSAPLTETVVGQPTDSNQPTVTIILQGTVGIGREQSTFNIQTTVSRRTLDA